MDLGRHERGATTPRAKTVLERPPVELVFVVLVRLRLSPAAAQRDVEADIGLQPRQLGLHQRVLGGEQALLRGLKQRQNVDGAFAILQFGDAEGFGGSAHFLGQRHQLVAVGRDLAQRRLHIGEGGEHGLAVIGDLFLLLGQGQIVLRP